MKKKLFLAGLLVAALMTASCSDDISDDKGGSNDSKNEVGYVKVSINLPSASGNMTKANENGNDNFDDGVEAEYNVNDVILAIFEGTSESDASCINIENLTELIPAKVGDNITVKYSTRTIEIKKPAENKKLYALVIANGKSTYENNLAGKKLSDLNTIAEPVDLSKIADTSDKGNFLMTNSPISNEPGAAQKSDSREVTTFVPLTVYDTEAQAEVNSPDQIYLERAVAKVTTSVKGGGNVLTIRSNNQSATYNEATVTFEGWRLQLTNKKFYPVRNVADWKTWDTYYVGNELNRFYGYVEKPYRVYWAIDPNYGTTNDGDLNKYQKVSDVTEWNELGNNEYCAENTTTAGQMSQSKLTNVLLKAKFRLKDATENDNLFMGANTSTIYKENDFINLAKSKLTGENALSSSENIKVKADATAKTITTAEGVKTVFCKNDGSADSELSDAQAAAILTATDGTIKFYKGGVMYYYSTVIKHFGNNPTEFNGDTANPSYEEDKHLGRYGVVRNNWYELRINSVSGPGEPEIPTIPDEPVDKKHSYINAEINVLSWAKRTDDIDL